MVGEWTDVAPGGCLDRETKLGDECPVRARLERGAAMANDARSHRNPSVVNRQPRRRDEASLGRIAPQTGSR